MAFIPSMERHAAFTSFGRCVFCMSGFGPQSLTDEHIVPLFLNGTWIIRGGTCIRCAKQSNDYYENSASNTTFLSIRLFLGLDRRKSRKKEYPRVAMGNQLYSSRSNFDTLLQNDDRPKLFTMPCFQPAGILRGVYITDHELIQAEYLQFDHREFKIETVLGRRIRNSGRAIMPVRTHMKSDDIDITVDEEHDINAFLLTLAKIGYCYAVATLGSLDTFDSRSIRALLLGERRDVANFVGGLFQAEDFPCDFLHGLHIRVRGGALTVVVHLFSCLNIKPYEVVVCPGP
jgi:hypothetical protein